MITASGPSPVELTVKAVPGVSVAVSEGVGVQQLTVGVGVRDGVGVGVSVGVAVGLGVGVGQAAGVPIGVPEIVQWEHSTLAGGSLAASKVTDSPLSTQGVPQSRSRVVPGAPLKTGAGQPGAFWET